MACHDTFDDFARCTAVHRCQCKAFGARNTFLLDEKALQGAIQRAEVFFISAVAFRAQACCTFLDDFAPHLRHTGGGVPSRAL